MVPYFPICRCLRFWPSTLHPGEPRTAETPLAVRTRVASHRQPAFRHSRAPSLRPGIAVSGGCDAVTNPDRCGAPVGELLLNRVLSHIVLTLSPRPWYGRSALLILRLPQPSRPSPGALASRLRRSGWRTSWYWPPGIGVWTPAVGVSATSAEIRTSEGAVPLPQMITPWESDKNWRPGFVDYLFLAFNTSTAFSPTNVPVPARWAKLMMTMQALISLATVSLLAARAVNIL